MSETQLIGSGKKRTRSRTYSCVYLDSKGPGHRRKYWRAECWSFDTSGPIRLRKWFKYREDALKWLGKSNN